MASAFTVEASLVEAKPLALVVSVPTTSPVVLEITWNRTPAAGRDCPSVWSHSPLAPLVLATSRSNALTVSLKSSSGARS